MIHQDKKILIIGAGPSGLAAALLFLQYGYEDITVIEHRSSPSDFEKNKAFTYQIDGRGQKLIKQLGLDTVLPDYGVANKKFTSTVIPANGEAKQFNPPVIHPDRVTCYWTTRQNLQIMLNKAVEERNDGRVRLCYDHNMTGISLADDGRTCVSIRDADNKEELIKPDVLLACDGLSSQVRQSLTDFPGITAKQFEMIRYPSPAAKLMYKVINLPPVFSINGSDTVADNNRTSYILSSAPGDRQTAMSLMAFPVANPEHPRSVNIIREPDHHIWTLEDPNELLDFLEKSFPQLDIKSVITLQEAKDFVGIKTGKFPTPQHARALYARLGNQEHQTDCLLIGDSAHAFPPDLGLGVNSAFEDLHELSFALERADGDFGIAFQEYEKLRLGEIKALVQLVQTVFPYQYNQSPWRFKLFVIGFAVRSGLHKIAPKLFDRPAFQMVQSHMLAYTDILRRKKRSDLIVRGLGVLILALVIYLISLLF